MSQNRLRMEGLDELREALRQLPEELAQEAGAIVMAHAEEAQRRVQQAYPQGPTGNLRRGVTTNREASRFGAKAIVRSRAPHAHLFEYGSRPRRTQRGANRGQMPAGSEAERMIPIIIRVRRNMVAALIHMVQKAGFTVTSS